MNAKEPVFITKIFFFLFIMSIISIVSMVIMMIILTVIIIVIIVVTSGVPFSKYITVSICAKN